MTISNTTMDEFRQHLQTTGVSSFGLCSVSPLQIMEVFLSSELLFPGRRCHLGGWISQLES